MFTERQRTALIERLARAVLWQESTEFARDNAKRTARTVVRELEQSPASDMAVRRAITKVTERLDESA